MPIAILNTPDNAMIRLHGDRREVIDVVEDYEKIKSPIAKANPSG
jgi:hypothetical protein